MATYRQLGNSDLKVSSVALGCWPIAGVTSLDVNDDDSLKTIQAAKESGINFFDTAHCYGLCGESEKLVGKAIGKRADYVIASKCGVHFDAAEKKAVDGTPARLMWECDESLRRLGTDFIDLMYLHEPDSNLPIQESAVAFLKMIESGRVRYVGLSNVNLQQIEDFIQVCPIVAIQPPFNLMQQKIRAELVPWCVANNVSIVSYWPLMKGLLAGRIRRDFQFHPKDKRLTYDIFQGESFENAQTILDRLDGIGARVNLSVAQLVIAWTINQPFVTSALCGAKRDWQIQETAVAMNVELDDLILKEISDLVDESS